MPDRIHLTVAAVVEKDDRFLIVRELSDGNTVLNQPAGHVEPGETLLTALKRETYEETGWRISPQGVLNISSYTSPNNGVTYYRVAILASAVELDAKAKLEKDILEVLWLSYEEVIERRKQLRSPMVLDCIEDYRSGRVYPLELLREHR